MRVLVIEDDPRIARDITRALEASGYVVESVSDGRKLGSAATPKIMAPLSLIFGSPKWTVLQF